MEISKKVTARPLYDDIAASYEQNVIMRPEREAIYIPLIKRAMGDVSGERIIDFACGNGYYSRLFHSLGAVETVGVDVSREMIARAQELSPECLKFQVADVSNMSVIGTFDKAFAAFLLHYARDVNELQAMCRTVAAHIEEGGKFVALTNSPFHPEYPLDKYLFQVTARGTIHEGASLEVTFYSEAGPACRFAIYHWSKETYEQGLYAAGFHSIQWVRLDTIADTLSREAGEYWNDYIQASNSILVIASK